MKILQVIPNLRLAGAERMLEALALSLKERDHEVCVVSFYNDTSDITNNLVSHSINVLYLNKKVGLDVSATLKLAKIIKEFNPDVIHTHLYILVYTYLARLKSGVSAPIIHTVHSKASKENINIYRKINRYIFKHSNTFPVALSSIIQSTIYTEYPNVKKEVPVIWNGVMLERVKPMKSDYAIADNFNILHVGRFTEAKNHVNIIEAFGLLQNDVPNATLTFYGDGPLLKSIQDLVETKNYKEKIFFKGVDSNVTAHFCEYDVFILPSIFEGMPITIIEAMAVGMPILATDVGGIPDMIDNGKNGMLVQPSDNEIYKGLLKLYKDEELRKQLANEAIKSSALFSAEAMAKKYIEYYEKVSSKK